MWDDRWLGRRPAAVFSLLAAFILDPSAFILPRGGARPQLPQQAVEDVLDVVDPLLEEGRVDPGEGGDVLVEGREQRPLGAGPAGQAGLQVALDGAVAHDEKLGVEDRPVVL